LSAASAQHQHQQGPEAITRESAERMQLVMANVSGRDLGAVVAAIYLKVTRDGWGIASLCARWQRYRSGTALDSQADAAAA
jgi:hypothetical protein